MKSTAGRASWPSATSRSTDGARLTAAAVGARGAFLRRRFAEEGIDIGKSTSQVMPVMVNNDPKVFAIAEKIQDRGLFLQPVTYPAVPKHKSRLRVSVSAAHSEEQLETAVQVIAGVLREEGICRA